MDLDLFDMEICYSNTFSNKLYNLSIFYVFCFMIAYICDIVCYFDYDMSVVSVVVVGCYYYGNEVSYLSIDFSLLCF